jgi:hypothetical protein
MFYRITCPAPHVAVSLVVCSGTSTEAASIGVRICAYATWGKIKISVCIRIKYINNKRTL